MAEEAVQESVRRHKAYSQELKLAAVKDVLEKGVSCNEVIERYEIASRSPLSIWCKLYREGGEEALKPKTKGRPKGSFSKKKKENAETDKQKKKQNRSKKDVKSQQTEKAAKTLKSA